MGQTEGERGNRDEEGLEGGATPEGIKRKVKRATFKADSRSLAILSRRCSVCIKTKRLLSAIHGVRSLSVADVRWDGRRLHPVVGRRRRRPTKRTLSSSSQHESPSRTSCRTLFDPTDVRTALKIGRGCGGACLRGLSAEFGGRFGAFVLFGRKVESFDFRPALFLLGSSPAGLRPLTLPLSYPPTPLLNTFTMAKIKERGKTGAAKNYITRNQALKKYVVLASGPAASPQPTLT